MLDAMKVKEVSVENYFTKNYNEPVYVHIDAEHYNKRKDGKPFDKNDFYKNPSEYVSDFGRFAKSSDIFMAGHFYASGAPVILTADMLKAADNRLKVVADISCDIAGPIACTLRSSTIAEPFYGYNPSDGSEVDIYHPAAIVVLAVDNLPCELPKDASEGFGDMFLEHIIPAFFNDDIDGVLKRSQITDGGRLTDRFSYLKDYITEKENVPHI